MTAITLYRTDPTRNMHRYYRLDVQPDLFGGWCVISEWGRIGRGGQLRAHSCPAESDARAMLNKQLHRKQRRGYFR